MKKIQLTGKLALNKQTVTKLNDKSMKTINGGRVQLSVTEADQNPCVIATQEASKCENWCH